MATPRSENLNESVMKNAKSDYVTDYWDQFYATELHTVWQPRCH